MFGREKDVEMRRYVDVEMLSRGRIMWRFVKTEQVAEINAII